MEVEGQWKASSGFAKKHLVGTSTGGWKRLFWEVEKFQGHEWDKLMTGLEHKVCYYFYKNSECIDNSFRSEKKLKNYKWTQRLCTNALWLLWFLFLFYGGFRINFLVWGSSRGLN